MIINSQGVAQRALFKSEKFRLAMNVKEIAKNLYKILYSSAKLLKLVKMHLPDLKKVDITQKTLHIDIFSFFDIGDCILVRQKLDNTAGHAYLQIRTKNAHFALFSKQLVMQLNRLLTMLRKQKFSYVD